MQVGKPSRVRETGEPARLRRYTVAGQAVEAPQLASGLYLVATPIGNLRDVTLRALEILAAADLVACEDTRVTRKLFGHYGCSTPLLAYHGECRLYHALKPSKNVLHPTRKPAAEWACPVCGQ